MSETLVTKYRPDDWDAVVGNEASVKALKEAIYSQSRPHSYLFTGPSGCGKTTLARIIAKHVDADIHELDAASHSGVDDMRQLVEMSKFTPLGGRSRLHIIDECHALSKAGWQALLKLLEDVPPKLYFALCSTESSKIPETIKTRCYPITLRPLKPNDISAFIDAIAGLENWTVNNDVFNSIVGATEGSPRRALTLLQAGHAAASLEELSQILANVDSDSSSVVELCRLLVGGNKNWKRISQLLGKIDDYDEAVLAATRYLVSVMIRSEEKQSRAVWEMIEAFTGTDSWDKKTQFHAAIGRILWGPPPF